MVKRMSAQTQFIFISHSKITMEFAQQLVGVTMQEQGVSRVVEVDIEEALRLADPARSVTGQATRSNSGIQMDSELQIALIGAGIAAVVLVVATTNGGTPPPTRGRAGLQVRKHRDVLLEPREEPPRASVANPASVPPKTSRAASARRR